MDAEKFKEMDQSLMKKMEPLREQKVSEGMLKGFSASVERRIAGGAQVVERKPAGRLLWVPVLAVMVMASVIVLRSPVQNIELTQAVTPADEMQDEIAVLAELGVLDEYEDAELLTDEEALLDENMELTQNRGGFSTLA
jgi:hypothetical protein